ncbi:hypothetical protein [Afipia carboxidovorans]|uniref:hypothetical protein n=1 Tax=Afipia carboxidovorans TaxID=40137 RepID=UPI003091CE75|nr:hypothetical protein CRBSH125_09630 [Afipia carboxidovorans]
MIDIPLSQIGSVDQFAIDVQHYIDACTAHMLGKPGVPAPRSSELVERVVARIPEAGPVAARGPDKFVALPYQIIDDLPKTPEQQKAIDLLRETIG